ncbi:hypothetical protein [Neorhodopirellula pilleata]|uniref:Uncharacterized protein n=1 Tax=Neorhodopirellula pilleata TaxID=2714738 RepID=A0A5C5ZZM7_9BACT|nr:hypothetical protein [Neorhodopirellula pilleata]TWT92606.1 hypothetical protein Pla100_46260 [Neorhodopirellula pilleata]
MKMPLKQQCEACRDGIFAAIIDVLHERSEYITSIERTARGELPITGIALELSPWHGGLGLSLRLSTDFPLGDFRYDSADWPHFDFTHGCASPSIDQAISIVTEIYNQGKEPGNDLREMAHLTFMAGAEAILNPSVARLLNGEEKVSGTVFVDPEGISP